MPQDIPKTLDLGVLEWSKFHLSHYHQQPPSVFHHWLAPRLDRLSTERGRYIVVQAPRGEAKSTYISLFFVLKQALERKEDYILIISETRDQTIKLIGHIREEIESNSLLKAQYPAALSHVRSNMHRIVLGNGVIIEGLSSGQSIRGARKGARRPTLIIVDDPEGDESKISPTIRSRIKDWYTTAVLKAGEPTTNFIVLATAIHMDCLSMTLAKTAGWESKTFGAILQWPDNMDLWKQWEQIYTSPTATDREREQIEKQAEKFILKNWKALHKGAVVSWPERYSLVSLMKERARDGHAAFMSERQNVPINPEDREWPIEYFDEHIWVSEMPSMDQLELRVAFNDPSKGRQDKFGDYASSVFVGSKGNLLYVDSEHVRKPAGEMVEGYARFCDQRHCHAAGLETNVFQELLAPMFEAAQVNQGFSTPLYPIVQTIKKEVRIRLLTPYLQQKRLRFVRNKGNGMLVEMMQNFPNGDFDDGPDALAGAIDLGYQLASGQIVVRKDEPDALDALMAVRG